MLELITNKSLPSLKIVPLENNQPEEQLVCWLCRHLVVCQQVALLAVIVGRKKNYLETLAEEGRYYMPIVFGYFLQVQAIDALSLG